MTLCPCNSDKPYSQCCQLGHHSHASITTPEQLMRSRYSAHVLGLVDYVVNTYHPSCHAEQEREAIAQSIDSHWCELDVLSTEPGQHDEEGFVSFKAYFIEDDQQYCLAERSRFVRENGLWYYIDGDMIATDSAEEKSTKSDPRLQQSVAQTKIGRNDPCLCGSGKKFKKCCG